MPSSNTPLWNLILLIDVTFSTPTGVYTSVRFSLAFFGRRRMSDEFAETTVRLEDQKQAQETKRESGGDHDRNLLRDSLSSLLHFALFSVGFVGPYFATMVFSSRNLAGSFSEAIILVRSRRRGAWQ